jgi:hypothetical protein
MNNRGRVFQGDRRPSVGNLPGRFGVFPWCFPRHIGGQWYVEKVPDFMVPRKGFEPPTHALRMRCSTG